MEGTKAIVVITEIEQSESGYTKITDEKGEVYSVWDEKLKNIFRVGGVYEISYTTKGRYKNIVTATEIKPKFEKVGYIEDIKKPLIDDKRINDIFKDKCDLLLACRDFILKNFDAKDFPERHTLINSLFIEVNHQIRSNYYLENTKVYIGDKGKNIKGVDIKNGQ